MTTDMWESVYRRAQRRAPDQEDPTVTVAEGRVHGRAYRIIYATLDDGCIVPMTIFPITGFPIERRGLH
jgi:hypothetical protein